MIDVEKLTSEDAAQELQRLAQQALVSIPPEAALAVDVVLGGDFEKIETLVEAHHLIVDHVAVGESDAAGIGMETGWVHVWIYG